MKALIIFIVTILFCATVTAQKDVNNYKYILIPKQFDFLKRADQYQVNSLTKFLFNKYGFDAYFIDDELPQDLRQDRCLALTGNVNKHSGIFKTKLEVTLTDCYGNIVAQSRVGESRLKKFDRAYAEALRDAFITYEEMDYKYQPHNVIQKRKEEISFSDENPELPKPQPSVKFENENNHLISTNTDYKAIKVTSGFKLMDSENNVVLTIFNTPRENMFLVKDKSAIVFKKNDQWIYYESTESYKLEKIIKIQF
ncbi:hypothetical protein [Winogradskyella ursingii]|uniref:hypothetical protein n=1 Tax=Winogradskyella ursingii TaxID=2686079 RepID=UPI0015CDE911|nr:hypothetical protein [Winogradskyella ursingii]